MDQNTPHLQLCDPSVKNSLEGIYGFNLQTVKGKERFRE